MHNEVKRTLVCKMQRSFERFCLPLAALLMFSATAHGQQISRTVQLDGLLSNDPVKVVGFKANGILVQVDTPFQATEEQWLQSSSVVVKNVSKKVVVGVRMNLWFPQTAYGTAQVGNAISVGHRNTAGMYSSSGKKLADDDAPELSLISGETTEIPLRPQFESTEEMLNKKGFDRKQLSILRVRFVLVFFKDDTIWGPNYFAKADPEHPGRFIPILPSEFYGYVPRKSSVPTVP